jgi:6-phosphogluconolactonase (cycloisomerase 2 family)
LLLSALVGCGGNGTPPSYLYTIGSGANNVVYGYRIHDDGTLSAVEGSPFATGGRSLSKRSFISDNALISDAGGRHLFAVNPASRDVSVMRIGAGGALQAVAAPFSTGGAGVPNSLALSGDVLFAAHNGDGPTDCSGCELRGLRFDAAKETLAPIANAVLPQPALPISYPLAIGFNPGGDVLIATHFAFEFKSPDAHRVESYKLERASGLLSAAPGSPFLNSLEHVDSQPLGFVFNPAHPDRLFVANNVNVPAMTGTISEYTVDTHSGQISAMPGSPFPTNELNSSWLAITGDGAHLYASNSAADTITHFAVATDGALQRRGSITVIDGRVGNGPRDMVITGDNRYLFVLDGHGVDSVDGGSIVGFTVGKDGELTRLPAAPTALANERPFGLVLVGGR